MVHIEPMHLLLLRKVLQLAQVMKVYKVRLEQFRIKNNINAQKQEQFRVMV